MFGPFLAVFRSIFRGKRSKTGIFGIQNKGYIKKDFDADFTIVDLNKIIEIKNDKIESKCGWSPFDGYKFKGTPIATIINGEIKMKNGKILGNPSGKPILFK